MDAQNLREQFAINTRANERINHGADDDLDYMALGYTIHNLYGIMENACLRIARFFENGLPSNFWHKELLERMRLEIPTIRRAFLSKEEFVALDELRAFRHVFRNLYNKPIDRGRLTALQQKVPSAVQLFLTALDRYDRFLAELQEQL